MVACETCAVREGMRVAVLMGKCVRVGMSVSPATAVPTTVPATPGITQRRGGQDQGNGHNASRQRGEFHGDPPFVGL